MSPIATAIEAVRRLIEAYPELASDETLRADMLEGETDAIDIAGRLVQSIREDESTIAALKDLVALYTAKKDRAQARNNSKRAALLELLDAMQLRSFRTPAGTVSRQAGRRSLSYEVDNLPQGYFTLVRTPDTEAIKAAIDAGKTIPGVISTIGPDYVRIT